jgi:hypothetical protein
VYKIYEKIVILYTLHLYFVGSVFKVIKYDEQFIVFSSNFRGGLGQYFFLFLNTVVDFVLSFAAPADDVLLTIYALVIYTAPCIMFWMGAYTLRGEVERGWALEFPSFLGPVK